jgi:hypothetical protein
VSIKSQEHLYGPIVPISVERAQEVRIEADKLAYIGDPIIDPKKTDDSKTDSYATAEDVFLVRAQRARASSEHHSMRSPVFTQVR